jgi:hypothetical protein
MFCWQPVQFHCPYSAKQQAGCDLWLRIASLSEPSPDSGPSSLYIHSHFCTLDRTCNGWYGQSQSRQQLHISTLPEGYQVGLIARMETKEILLETDAPFLPPYPECKINYPWNLEVVAQEVSRLRNVPLSMLMTAINQNTIQFYGLDSKR